MSILKFKISILKFPFLEKEDIEMRGGKKAFMMKGVWEWETDQSFFQMVLSFSFCVPVPSLTSNKWKQTSYLWAYMQTGGKKTILTFFSDLAGAEGHVFSS